MKSVWERSALLKSVWENLSRWRTFFKYKYKCTFSCVLSKHSKLLNNTFPCNILCKSHELRYLDWLCVCVLFLFFILFYLCKWFNFDKQWTKYVWTIQYIKNKIKKKQWFVYTYAIGLIACHNNEDKVNPKLLNSLAKSLSYLTCTLEDILFGIDLESHNMKSSY